jgi:hypothetical protein
MSREDAMLSRALINFHAEGHDLREPIRLLAVPDIKVGLALKLGEVFAKKPRAGNLMVDITDSDEPVYFKNLSSKDQRLFEDVVDAVKAYWREKYGDQPAEENKHG